MRHHPLRLAVLLAAAVAAGTQLDSSSFEFPTKDTPAPGPRGRASVVQDPANIIALELNGAWVPDVEVARRMGLPVSKGPTRTTVQFRDSESWSKLVMDAIQESLPSRDRNHPWRTAFRDSVRRIYKTGEVVFERPEDPISMGYALFVWRGNPTLLLANERDRESVHVMLARDPDGDHDLLFIGGDKTREHFVPFMRKK